MKRYLILILILTSCTVPEHKFISGGIFSSNSLAIQALPQGDSIAFGRIKFFLTKEKERTNIFYGYQEWKESIKTEHDPINVDMSDTCVVLHVDPKAKYGRMNDNIFSRGLLNDFVSPIADVYGNDKYTPLFKGMTNNRPVNINNENSLYATSVKDAGALPFYGFYCTGFSMNGLFTYKGIDFEGIRGKLYLEAPLIKQGTKTYFGDIEVHLSLIKGQKGELIIKDNMAATYEEFNKITPIIANSNLTLEKNIVKKTMDYPAEEGIKAILKPFTPLPIHTLN